MLLQKVAMIRGGGPSKPAAAPVLPFDPDGPIIKNLEQGHHQRTSSAAVTNGLVAPARDGGGQEAVQEFIARQVVIQHVDTVNIYVTSAHADGRDPQKSPAA